MLIQTLNGLVYGGLLYIAAVGLVLIFGLRHVVNFAHGSLFTIGAYVGFSAVAVGNFWLGLAATILALGALGALLDLAVFRPLQRQDHLTTLLVTFGLSLVLENAVRAIWGTEFRTMPVPQMFSGSVDIAGESFPIYRIAVIALAIVVSLGLSLWLKYSQIGLYVRASSTDPVTTAIQGVNTNSVSITVVAVGVALAGLSGTVSAPLLALSPTMGQSIVIQSFMVVVIGGLGSFAGAFVAALVIGQIYSFGIVFMPWATSVLPFVLMVIVLVWRPAGLAGRSA